MGTIGSVLLGFAGGVVGSWSISAARNSVQRRGGTPQQANRAATKVLFAWGAAFAIVMLYKYFAQ